MTLVCDLCGSPDATPVLEVDSNRALRSDRAIVAARLSKSACRVCGLIRNTVRLDDHWHAELYAEAYAQAPQGGHTFFTAEGPRRRADVMADWLSACADPWDHARTCLEIGAGDGSLLASLSTRHPSVAFEGLELQPQAAAAAAARGFPVRTTPVDALGDATWSAIVAVAVVEHVPSPRRFLGALAAHLEPDGWLLLCQPTQDVPSSDLFFIDHVHHFATAHLEQYATELGFEERQVAVGHPLMPNFSLHVWQRHRAPQTVGWPGPPARTAAIDTATRLLDDFRRCDRLVAELTAAGRRTAVFGIAEVFALFQAYTRLDELPLVCALADPPWPDPWPHDIPLCPPEDAVRYGVQDVILTMNRVYYPDVHRRLAPLGVRVHETLSV